MGSAERMKDVARLVNCPGKKIVVLSAMSGTTDHLVKLTNALYKHNIGEATGLLNELEPRYRNTVEALFNSDEAKKKGNDLITEHFNLLRSFTLDMFTHNEEKTILAEGELLSTALFHYYLEEQKVPSVLLSALNFMRIDENGEPDLQYIESNLKIHDHLLQV